MEFYNCGCVWKNKKKFSIPIFDVHFCEMPCTLQDIDLKCKISFIILLIVSSPRGDFISDTSYTDHHHSVPVRAAQPQLRSGGTSPPL